MSKSLDWWYSLTPEEQATERAKAKERAKRQPEPIPIGPVTRIEALGEFLKVATQRKAIRLIVCAGHIHNYERFFQDGIQYVVSGGGGAKPRPVVRQACDLYHDESFPNYNYVKFTLRKRAIEAEMIRVADPSADTPRWDVKDRFEIRVR